MPSVLPSCDRCRGRTPAGSRTVHAAILCAQGHAQEESAGSLHPIEARTEPLSVGSTGQAPGLVETVLVRADELRLSGGGRVGLPTTQTVYMAAQRYQHGIVVAKDTVFITTVAAVPAMAVMAAFLSWPSLRCGVTSQQVRHQRRLDEPSEPHWASSRRPGARQRSHAAEEALKSSRRTSSSSSPCSAPRSRRRARWQSSARVQRRSRSPRRGTPLRSSAAP